MCNRRSTFLLAVLISFCLALTNGCNPQVPTSVPLPPSATSIPPTATSSPTETRTPLPSPTPMLNPVAMGYHRMAYDIESDRIVLVAGQGNHCAKPEIVTSIFDLNTNAWQMLQTDASEPQGEGPMAYDTQSDRVIQYIGIPPGCSNFSGVGQTWAYDTNTNTWMDMEPSESPFGLIGARMVYDSESDRMILFGGLNADDFSVIHDTWAYDYETNSWKNMHPAGNLPDIDNFFAMSYDVAADRVIAWGCAGGTIGVYDYNLNRWETQETEKYPSYCDYNAMVYDPGTGLHILFGGTKRSDESPSMQTWGYDYASNRWELFIARNPPEARGWHAMVYDTKAGVMVLFGGGKTRDKLTNETWVYDPVAREWSNVTVMP